MFRGVLVIAACAACAEVPSRGANATRGPEVSADGDAVLGSGFTLELASEGVRLPASLRLAETELLAEGGCTGASRIGVGLLPMQNVTAGPRAGLDPAQNTAEVSGGPVIVDIAVAFAVPYTCNQPEGPQTVSGRSTFRVFPNGRIARRDEVRAAMMNIQNAAVCRSCDTTSVTTAAVEAFWTFAGQATPTTTGRETCVDLKTHTIAVRWFDDGAVRHVVNADAVAFAYDAYAQSAAIPAAQQIAHSVLVVEQGSRPCAELVARLNPPPLVVEKDGEQRALVLGNDLVYTDTSGHSGRFSIRAMNGGGFADGFALQLALGAPEHLAVERANGTPVEYTLQAVGDETLLWIEDGIPAGDAILIEVL